jgi:cation-transporting ATPase 13A3/4/5
VNGNGSSSINSEDFLLENLLVIDYRYAKFALDPTSGSFIMVKCVTGSLSGLISLLIYENRDWRDPGWTGVGSVKNGLEGPLRQQRLTLFGSNIIDIEGKSVISLLVDEVSFCFMCHSELSTDLEIGHPPFLRLPDRQHHTVVI